MGRVDSSVGAPFVLDVSGSPRTMGLAQGEALRTPIVELYERRLELVSAASPSASLADVLGIASALWRQVVRLAPTTAIEAGAVAEAAGLSPGQLVVAGAYTDLIDVVVHAFPQAHRPHFDECTVAVSAELGYVAGTWDSHPGASDALVVLTRRPLTGPPTLALSTAGWPVQQGLNGDGLVFAITNLTPPRSSRAGLPYIAAVAEVSAQRSTESAVAWLANSQFCSGHSYLVADGQSAAVVETSAQGAECWPVVDVASEANHYRAQSRLADNSAYEFFDGSLTRQRDMEALAPSVHGHLDLFATVASHPRIRRAAPNVETGATFFASASDRVLYWTLGAPADADDFTASPLT